MTDNDLNDSGGSVTPPSNVNSLLLEQELHSRLSGVRLVCEIALDDDLHRAVTDSMRSLVRRSPTELIVSLYPATLVVYLVSSGVRHYDYGEFWPNLEVPGVTREWAGPGFLAALEQLDLPLFEDELVGGMRYVAKILFHGGIPRFSAHDVVHLVARCLQHDPGDAEGLLTRWRRDQSVLDCLDKPARRFLLHGGEDSLVVIDRLIDLFRRVATEGHDDLIDAGLPGYLVSEFSDLPRSLKSAGKSFLRPRARVRLGQVGPVMELPAHRDGAEMRWSVETGEERAAVQGSAVEVQTARLRPARRWIAELDDGRKRYRFEFRGSGSVPIYIFDPTTGLLLARQDRLPAGRAIVVAPKRYEFRQGGPDGATAKFGIGHADLALAWSRYSVFEVLAEAGQQIWVGDPADGNAPTALLAVTRPPTRPRLRGALLPGLWADDSIPVYAGMPGVVMDAQLANPANHRYRVRCVRTGHVMTGSLADLAREPEEFVLPSFGNAIDIVQVDVTGPTGAELRGERVCVLGVDVQLTAPANLVGPSDPVEVRLDFAGTVLAATAAEGECLVQMSDERSGVRFVYVVNRVRWALRTARVSAPWTTRPLGFALPDLAGADGLGILVEAAPGATVTLALVAADRVLQHLEVRLKPDQRIAEFDLSAFADTAATAPEGRLTFLIKAFHGAESVSAAVATVADKFEVHDLEVGFDGKRDLLLATWTENTVFPDRRLRLWPAVAIDGKPSTHLIDKEQIGADSWVVADNQPVGPFLCEVAIDDGWTIPVRPTDPSTYSYVEIGRDIVEDRTCSVPGVSPIVTHVWGGGAQPETPEALKEAASWLLELTAVEGASVLRSRDGRALREALFAKPEAGIRALLRSFAEWPASSDVLAMAQLCILDDALAVPASGFGHAECRQLSEVALLLWAATASASPASRWASVTGWTPSLTLPPPAPPVFDVYFRKTVSDIEGSLGNLEENTHADGRSVAFPLSWGRHQAGVFEWLGNENPRDHRRTRSWQDSWSHLRRPDTFGAHRSVPDVLAHLEVRSSTSQVTRPEGRFPLQLQACALHLVLATAQRPHAHRALLEAFEFAPTLAMRSALLAVGVARFGTSIRAAA